MTFGEAAAFFERSVARIEPELVAATTTVMEVARTNAQSVIGVGAPGWAPLKDTTIERKVRGGYAVPAPLKRTGQMRAGIEIEVIPMRSSVFGAVGSDDKAAVFQEMGTSRMPARPFRMPARPFLAYGLMEAIPSAILLYTNVLRNLFVPGGGR